MMKKKKSLVGLIVVAVVVIAVVVGIRFHGVRLGKDETVRYGITPYQDSALPVVAAELGWYKQKGLNVEMVPVTWGDAIMALSGGAIDVVIYNFNSFQPPYEHAAQGRVKPVFYCPLYLFKGQAIMVKGDSGLECFRDAPGESIDAREHRIAKVAAQLKGKKIGVTQGTELDQIVLAALKKAGLTKEDVQMFHAAPEDSLAAFLAGNLDAFAAGLTERVEARRRGGTELLVTADVMRPVIDGIVTTESFAKQHPDIMTKLVDVWFQTIRFMEADLNKNSVHILKYLSTAASTRYSPEEYAIAWTFNVFPKDRSEANSLFNDPSSPSYWKISWDANNEYLIQEGKVKKPVPYSAYWGETVLGKMAEKQ